MSLTDCAFFGSKPPQTYYRMNKDRSDIKISTIIRRWFFIVIFAASVISLISVIAVQAFYQQIYAYELIEEDVRDINDEISEKFGDMLYESISQITVYLEEHKDKLMDDEWIDEFVGKNADALSELNVVDSRGIIVKSSKPEYVGWDMRNGEQSAEFMCLLNGEDYYEQPLRGNSYDENRQMIYAGKAFSDGSGFLEIGLSEENYENFLNTTLAEGVRNRRVGIEGAVVICDASGCIIESTDDKFNGQIIQNRELFSTEEGEYKRSRADIFGMDCYVVSVLNRDYSILGGFPVSEAGRFSKIDKILIVVMNVIILLSVSFILTRFLQGHVVKGIEDINESLTKITKGDLEVRADVKSSREFNELSGGINKTVERLKQMIAEADARIDKELTMASSIQQASLPDRIGVFRNNKAFELYADMETAKTVGGDFYDFYMPDSDTLVVTIADVSDKGIPAAMFMMRAKALLKHLAEEDRSVEDMVTAANNGLWENNEGSMFVSAWIGFIDLKTGVVKYVHAGHTCPVLFGNAAPEFVRQEREMVLGAMPDLEFHEQELKLQPGDALFLYTDGVTEAERSDGELYGNDRLISILSDVTTAFSDSGEDDYSGFVCKRVISDVHAFSEDMPQSDDITVLCVTYHGASGL